MSKDKEPGTIFEKQINLLNNQAATLRANAQDYELMAEYLSRQRELFEKFSQLPLSLKVARFISTELNHESSNNSNTVNQSQALKSTKNLPSLDNRRVYTIASKAKPIMNGLFGQGRSDVPENLEALFKRMYGENWPSRSIDVPTGPGLKYTTRTYLEDIHSPNSYIKNLIQKADSVINRKMRKNTPPDFPYFGRVAESGLVQLYNKINTIGWDVYDEFMIFNDIRQYKNKSTSQ